MKTTLPFTRALFDKKILIHMWHISIRNMLIVVFVNQGPEICIVNTTAIHLVTLKPGAPAPCSLKPHTKEFNLEKGVNNKKNSLYHLHICTLAEATLSGNFFVLYIISQMDIHVHFKCRYFVEICLI